MARPRKPTAILELNGAFRKDPQRRRDAEPEPMGLLGDPPDALSPEEGACWRELSGIIPAGVLGDCDRWVTEVACRLMARMRKDGIGGRNGLTASELSQLIQCLSRMGMTPSDRSKVHVAKKDETKNRFTALDEESSVGAAQLQ